MRTSRVADGLFVLPDGIVLQPVGGLTTRQRALLGPLDGADQVAVTHAGYRVPTRLLSAPLARLVERFREPTRIVDAVLAYARDEKRDPFETMDSAFDALAFLVGSGLLVPPDSSHDDAVSAAFGPGEVVHRYRIDGVVSVMRDTQVYRATSSDGIGIALKCVLVEPGRSTGSGVDPSGSAGSTGSGSSPDLVTATGLAISPVAAVRHEASVLAHLAGDGVPRLVEHLRHGVWEVLALEWVGGEPVAAVAQRIRLHDQGLREAAVLCARVITAFDGLHVAGVLHGDVHPGNVLVDETGAVRLIDFGRARAFDAFAADALRDLNAPDRAAVAYFTEPEMAQAVLADWPLPPVTSAGEQYALAAMVFHLLTGVHHLPFSLDRRRLLSQIVEDQPRTFLDCGLDAWPSVEGVLRRALAKAPAERHPSVAAFRAAFDQAIAVPPATPFAGTSATEGFVAEATEMLLAGSCAGSAQGVYPGVDPREAAWVALRVAQTRQDLDLLAAADLWSLLATEAQPRDVATLATVAHVARARCDDAVLSRACGDIAGLPTDARGGLDLLGGRAGELIAAARTLEATSGTDADPGGLATWLATAHDHWWRRVRSDGIRAFEVPGAAHGGVGLLIADLLVHEALGRALADDHLALLDSAARAADARGAAPRTAQWCSGSAGEVLLWCEAAAAAAAGAGHRHLRLASDAARHCLADAADHPDLCCGLTGRAFALLRLHQVSGSVEWLDAARSLALAATRSWAEVHDPGGLRKGRLGTALLVIELEDAPAAHWPLHLSHDVDRIVRATHALP